MKIQGKFKAKQLLRKILYLLIGSIIGIIALFLIFFFFFDYPVPSRKTEQAWQDTFREAIIEGYSNFKGHFVDSDVSVYIFSYQLPTKLETKEAFAILRRQINDYSESTTRPGGWKIGGYTAISESPTELVLRRPVTYYTPEGFDEYHFLVNDHQKKITVMFANIDSEAELIKQYQYFLEKFYETHRKYVSSTK